MLNFENKTNIVIMIFIYGQSIITEIPNTSIKEKEEKIYEMGGVRNHHDSVV